MSLYLGETKIPNVKIDGGGKLDPVIKSKTITENGTYNAADDGADGYSPVMVNVSGGGGELKELEISINANSPMAEAFIHTINSAKGVLYQYSRIIEAFDDGTTTTALPNSIIYGTGDFSYGSGFLPAPAGFERLSNARLVPKEQVPGLEIIVG